MKPGASEVVLSSLIPERPKREDDRIGGVVPGRTKNLPIKWLLFQQLFEWGGNGSSSKPLKFSYMEKTEYNYGLAMVDVATQTEMQGMEISCLCSVTSRHSPPPRWVAGCQERGRRLHTPPICEANKLS